MDAVFYGALSGVLVAASAVPYVYSQVRGRIKINVASWILWTINGFALLLTYRLAGAEESLWPVVFAFLNPLIVLCIGVAQHLRDSDAEVQGAILHLWSNLGKFDRVCLTLGTIAITAGMFVTSHNQAASLLVVALVADCFAVVPTIVYLWREPENDRPFAWIVNGTGYMVALLAITDRVWTNYVLPIYMTITVFAIAAPLVLYRLRMRSPLGEWA